MHTQQGTSQQRTSKCSCSLRGSTRAGMPSGPGTALTIGFWYMFWKSSVGLMVGLLCMREHRSPCRQALGDIDGKPNIFISTASHAPNLEVKWAVDSVLLCPKNGCKVLSHGAAPRARNPRVFLQAAGDLRGACKQPATTSGMCNRTIWYNRCCCCTRRYYSPLDVIAVAIT